MSIAEKLKKFLDKLQNLPNDKKKVILWTVVVFAGIVMGYFWVNEVKRGIAKIPEATKDIKIPKFEMPEFPDFPDLSSLDVLKVVTPSDQNSILNTTNK